MTLAAKTTAIR